MNLHHSFTACILSLVQKIDANCTALIIVGCENGNNLFWCSITYVVELKNRMRQISPFLVKCVVVI